MDEAGSDYKKIMAYIDRYPAAVLSTVRDDGTPHGAVIYAVTASHHTLCIVTKTGTEKYKNITQRPDVALTFFDEREGSTLQVTGKAYIADDSQMISYVLDKMQKMHAMESGWLPPVSKVTAGDYAVVGVELVSARLTEFQSAGNSVSFTELQE